MKITAYCIFYLLIFTSNHVYAETGMVVKRFSSCDYYIADGPRGLYVLEWYGGHDPMEGERIIGNIGACLLYTSPSPRDRQKSRMPSSA